MGNNVGQKSGLNRTVGRAQASLQWHGTLTALRITVKTFTPFLPLIITSLLNRRLSGNASASWSPPPRAANGRVN